MSASAGVVNFIWPCSLNQAMAALQGKCRGRRRMRDCICDQYTSEESRSTLCSPNSRAGYQLWGSPSPESLFRFLKWSPFTSYLKGFFASKNWDSGKGDLENWWPPPAPTHTHTHTLHCHPPRCHPLLVLPVSFTIIWLILPRSAYVLTT